MDELSNWRVIPKTLTVVGDCVLVDMLDLNHQYHPERLLYPLKRVGERGEGKWKRLTWDEALDEISAKLKPIRDSGNPERFAFHQGRQRSKDALKRFLDAFGTKDSIVPPKFMQW